MSGTKGTPSVQCFKVLLPVTVLIGKEALTIKKKVDFIVSRSNSKHRILHYWHQMTTREMAQLPLPSCTCLKSTIPYQHYWTFNNRCFTQTIFKVTGCKSTRKSLVWGPVQRSPIGLRITS
jgi:hypothetical protein